MVVSRPSGTAWQLKDVGAKLSLRARLPGARVFDLAADGLRKARAAGLSTLDRLPLALPASWCVNSPADSRVLRRWTLSPEREVWAAIVDLLEEPQALDAASSRALLGGIRAIGPETRAVEAISKVLALLVPESVPLMPAPARAFVLGEAAPDDAPAFVAMIHWFRSAVETGSTELAAWACAHDEVPLCGAQVLDRILWFDSEGHRHFPAPAP